MSLSLPLAPAPLDRLAYLMGFLLPRLVPSKPRRTSSRQRRTDFYTVYKGVNTDVRAHGVEDNSAMHFPIHRLKYWLASKSPTQGVSIYLLDADLEYGLCARLAP